MPSYHYLALNQAGNQLSGVIEAADQASAQATLNNLKLSVVSINAIENAQMAAPNADSIKFEFEALDRDGKKVVGTISSQSLVKAFARLFDEYKLDITYLTPALATLAEKETARKAGIVEIQKEYETLFAQKSKKAEAQAEQASSEQMEKHNELMKKIEFTTKKIKEFLIKYNADLINEERETIQSYLNQLIRIKDSTNLEHIRATCEKMLEHIQRQELFIHEEEKSKESARFKIDTRSMLDDLKRTGLQKDIDIEKTAVAWLSSPILKPLADFIINTFTEQNPEIKKLKMEIKTVNSNIWAYAKMIIPAKTKVIRGEAIESIKTLLKERSRIKMKIKSIKIEERKILSSSLEQSHSGDHLQSVIGWLLSLYLITYLITYPFSIKTFSTFLLPKSFYFYQPRLTTIVTIFLFLSYGALGIRNYWLRRHPMAPYIIYPFTIFAFLLIIINLM